MGAKDDAHIIRAPNPAGIVMWLTPNSCGDLGQRFAEQVISRQQHLKSLCSCRNSAVISETDFALPV
jgi:hypothetical protein